MCVGQTVAPLQDLIENKIGAPITQLGKDASEAVDYFRGGHPIKGTAKLALALGAVAGPEEEGGRLTRPC